MVLTMKLLLKQIMVSTTNLQLINLNLANLTFILAVTSYDIRSKDTLDLLPGLASKPPLPNKRPNSVPTNSAKSSPVYSEHSSDRGIDAIGAYLSLKYETALKNKYNDVPKNGDRVDDDYFEKLVQNKKQTDKTKEEKKYNEDVTSVKFKDTMRENKSSHSLDNISGDYIYQDWVEDVVEKESETDKYLNQLKKGHGLIDRNLTDTSKMVEKSIHPWEKEENIPDISEIDIDQLFKDDIDIKFDKVFENKKLPTETKNSDSKIQTKKKVTLVKSVTVAKPKPKFIAKPLRLKEDFQESNKQKEPESWMSEAAKKSEAIANYRHTKKANYFDILSNLEEIESAVTSNKEIDIKDDIPEHDTDKSNMRSESIDDIVSILEVLENEDKKSREYILLRI